MKEKKNIDELFKAQFQNFEATPSPAVWDGIEARLKEKKKERRVIPIWWRVAGVAALIALLFTVGLSLFDTTTTPSNEIVTEEVSPKTNTNSTTNDDSSTIVDKTVISNETQVASENNTTTTTSERKTNVTTPKNNSIISEEKQINNSIVSNEAVAETGTNKRTNNTNTTTQNKTSNTQLRKTPSEKASTIYNTKKEAVAVAKNPNNKVNKNSETTLNPLVKDNTKVVSEKVGIAGNIKNENTTISEENKINKAKEIITTETEVATTTEAEENKKSIFDAIEENKQLEETKLKKEGPTNRWAVAPTVGPVYYGSLSEGSSIDPMFADNRQNGDVNLSYGVQVAYDISEKLTIRSGVNNVNLSYATGDVEVATAPVAFAIEAVDYGGRSAVTTVFDKGGIPSNTDAGAFGNIVPKSTGGSAEISQQLSYYEVPLELKYDLFDNRFGMNLIGGMSTLFLGNNELVVNDGDFRTVLGEANNLNSISFTTNIGLGFNYQLSKKLKFNIEPMFKYQLNPYTDSSIAFKPYYLGVYSGLSFKF